MWKDSDNYSETVTIILSHWEICKIILGIKLKMLKSEVPMENHWSITQARPQQPLVVNVEVTVCNHCRGNTKDFSNFWRPLNLTFD